MTISSGCGFRFRVLREGGDSITFLIGGTCETNVCEKVFLRSSMMFAQK